MEATAILNVLTTLTLIVGMFFLFVGALGVLRFPDVYLRAIAASKCVTLGITSMLLAAVFHFTLIGIDDTTQVAQGSSALAAATKAVLVILFQFVAGPIGAFMLARAAHIDRVHAWKGTLSDDLQQDISETPSSRTP